MATINLNDLSLSELKSLQKDVAKAIEPRRVCRRLISVSYAAMASVSRAA